MESSAATTRPTLGPGAGLPLAPAAPPARPPGATGEPVLGTVGAALTTGRPAGESSTTAASAKASLLVVIRNGASATGASCGTGGSSGLATGVVRRDAGATCGFLAGGVGVAFGVTEAAVDVVAASFVAIAGGEVVAVTVGRFTMGVEVV